MNGHDERERREHASLRPRAETAADDGDIGRVLRALPRRSAPPGLHDALMARIAQERAQQRPRATRAGGDPRPSRWGWTAAVGVFVYGWFVFVPLTLPLSGRLGGLFAAVWAACVNAGHTVAEKVHMGISAVPTGLEPLAGAVVWGGLGLAVTAMALKAARLPSIAIWRGVER